MTATTRTEAVVVAEVAEYISDLIKPELDAASIAQALVDNAAWKMAEEIHIEIPSRYTISGNPIPASFPAFTYDDE